MDAIDFSRTVFPALAIMANLLTIGILVKPTAFFTKPNQPLILGTVIAAGATVGSLFLSEAAGFIPCDLCWYQRIAMYPLVVILLLAAKKPANGGVKAAGVLAGIGLFISLWHYGVERIPALNDATSCSVSAPCATKWIDAYGFVTIPYMAGSAFLLILVSLLARLRLPGDKNVIEEIVEDTVAGEQVTEVESLAEVVADPGGEQNNITEK